MSDWLKNNAWSLVIGLAFAVSVFTVVQTKVEAIETKNTEYDSFIEKRHTKDVIEAQQYAVLEMRIENIERIAPMIQGLNASINELNLTLSNRTLEAKFITDQLKELSDDQDVLSRKQDTLYEEFQNVRASVKK